METVKSEKYRGYMINIHLDEDPQSPREWDNLGVIAYKHRNYALGEEEISDPIDWLAEKLGIDEPGDYCNENKDRLEALFLEKHVTLPLYLYDHSGITISTTPFSCCWDSGRLGYIYTTLEQLNKLRHNWKRWSAKRREKASKWLEEEVEGFDQYLTGDVYGFEIIDPDGENIDSCWGYYGYENIDELIEECKSTIDHEIKDVLKKRFSKVKEYINGSVPIIYRKLPELV